MATIFRLVKPVGYSGECTRSNIWYPNISAVLQTKCESPQDPKYRIWYWVSIPWYSLGEMPLCGLHICFVFSVSANDLADQDLQQTLISVSAGRFLLDRDLGMIESTAVSSHPCRCFVPDQLLESDLYQTSDVRWQLDDCGCSNPHSNVVYWSNYRFGTNDISGNLLQVW
jgi:hypothetical protein